MDKKKREQKECDVKIRELQKRRAGSNEQGGRKVETPGYPREIQIDRKRRDINNSEILFNHQFILISDRCENLCNNITLRLFFVTQINSDA